MTLEEKAKKLSKAVQEAKELRQNSDKDKIDNYIAGKVEENEEEKDYYRNRDREKRGEGKEQKKKEGKGERRQKRGDKRENREE